MEIDTTSGAHVAHAHGKLSGRAREECRWRVAEHIRAQLVSRHLTARQPLKIEDPLSRRAPSLDPLMDGLLGDAERLCDRRDAAT